MERPENTIVDASLPQLPLVLNELFMREFFREYFQGEIDNGSGGIRQCRIIGRRYKPGKRCTVTYALTFEKRPEPQILYTRIESPKGAGGKEAKRQTKGAALGSELGISVWRFPHDAKLRSLVELTKPEKLQGILTELAIFDSVGNGRSTELSIQPLNYVPRRHCALLVEVNHPDSKYCMKVFGKIYGDQGGASVFAVMRQLWQQQTARPKAFGVTEPLAYDAKRRVLWQHWLEGQTFLRFAKSQGLDRACVLTAIGLAALHQSKLEELPRYTQEDNLNKVRERSRLLSGYYPRLKKPTQNILSRLPDLVAGLKPSRLVPIHGDFNYSQVLFDFGKPVFVDFDSVSLGDPLYDVAHFVAGLHWLAAQKYFAATEIRLVIGLFCDLYKELIPWEVSSSALNAQVAMALVCRRAYKVFRQLEEDTLQKIEQYLALAEQYLNHGSVLMGWGGASCEQRIWVN